MKFNLIIGFMLMLFQVVGQDTLTLEACFRKAEKSRYSLILERSDLSVANVNRRLHKFSILPGVNAFSSADAGFGRILDPVSNQFSNTQVNSQSFGMNSSMNLFNGFNYFKERDKLELLQARSEMKRDQSLNGMYMDIASLYINLCLSQSQIKQSNQRLVHFEHLLSVQRALFESGKITQVDTLRTQNLVLKEQSEQDRLTEGFRTSLLQLNVLMGENLEQVYVFDADQISVTTSYLNQDELYMMKMNAIDVELLIVEEKLAKSSVLPSLTLNAAVGTRFSTSLKEGFDPMGSTMAYRDQLDLNLFQNVGFQLSIPLFNKGEYLRNARIRRVRRDQLLAQSELLELNLERRKKEVEIAYNGKLKQSQRLESSVENLENIYNVAMESYKAGKITFSELQDIFLEWQAEILNLEAITFELIRVRLMRIEE